MLSGTARVEILGLPIDLGPTGVEQLLAPESSGLTHIVTLNPEYVMAARTDGAFRDAIRRAELVVADGVGIVLALRLRGASARRMTGVDMVHELAGTGRPLFLLGAGPGVADEAATRLAGELPHARIVGTWAEGTPDPVHDAESLRRIVECRAEIVLVAYGAPGQVLWIERNRGALAAAGVRIAVGVGGALDYVAGRARRPHPIVRRLGLEWLARLVREPWRWRRQLVLPWFAILAAMEAVRLRGRSRGEAASRHPV